jgi:hypothetical protein
MKCYLCKVSDPNETHFNSKLHQICTVCSVKLWELAQKGIEFDLRKQTVLITTKNLRKKVKTNRTVTLSTGYEVNLEDKEGLEHLFNAIIGEVTTRLKDTEEFSEKGFSIVRDVCICELHFVAGQLHHMGSSIDIRKLLDEFSVQWDRVAEKLNRDKPDDDQDI